MATTLELDGTAGEAVRLVLNVSDCCGDGEADGDGTEPCERERDDCERACVKKRERPRACDGDGANSGSCCSAMLSGEEAGGETLVVPLRARRRSTRGFLRGEKKLLLLL